MNFSVCLSWSLPAQMLWVCCLHGQASLKRATGKTTPPPTEADEPTPAAQLSMSPLTPAEELKTSKVEEAGVTTE